MSNCPNLLEAKTTIYIETPKPGKYPRIIVDNNVFRRHYTYTQTNQEVTIRWRCVNVDKSKCKAVLYGTLQQGTVINALYVHNHENNCTKWDKLSMVSKEFTIIRRMKECKRGRLSYGGATKRKVVKKERVARKSKKPVEIQKEEESLSGVVKSKSIILHVEGQDQPVVVTMLESDLGRNSSEQDN